MSTMLIGSNLIAWTLQIGLLVALGALVPAVLRMPVPRIRLLYWQVLLVACLALPWVRSWRQEVVTGTIQVSSVITDAAAASAPIRRTIPFAEIVLWLLAAGVAIRLGLMGVGLARLAAYRRRGREMLAELCSACTATPPTVLLVSDEVASPVMFGWRNPVVLLPGSFPSLGEEMREAILRHELLHVERRDWLFTIAEELVRAVLWFHPAIWWVIGEIQLAREQTVDQAVIEMTRSRDPYVDALLLMAGVSMPGNPAQMDLAPAPMFLRRRHLKRRLMEAMKEVRVSTISRTRLACVLGAALVMVAAACWLATGAFPLAAAPQVVADSAGVAVNLNGSQLMHRSSVPYPSEALAKGIEGAVVVQVKLDAAGEATDAMVVSGPDELRRGVLQSVLTWHFDKSEGLTTRTVSIDFVKPAGPANTQPAAARTAVQTPKMLPRASSGGPRVASTDKVERIVVTGLSDQSRDELLSKLPIQEGGKWSVQVFAQVVKAVTEFDSHLTTVLAMPSAGTVELRIGLANTGLASTTVPAASGAGTRLAFFDAEPGTGGGAAPAAASAPLPPDVYRAGNGVFPPSLRYKVDPGYTEEATAAKYGGSVLLSVVVGTDGKADDIKVVKSLGMGLDEKAVEAVQKWVFKPGTLNGVPVKVRAQIEINFRLS